MLWEVSLVGDVAGDVSIMVDAVGGVYCRRCCGRCLLWEMLWQVSVSWEMRCGGTLFFKFVRL